jgi:hypothetical protein
MPFKQGGRNPTEIVEVGWSVSTRAWGVIKSDPLQWLDPDRFLELCHQSNCFRKPMSAAAAVVAGE